jgi:glycosyltransferase involved in cell wall biosynthesis
MTIKVLHLLSGFYPTRGGVETLVESLAQELKVNHSTDSIFVAPRYWHSRPDVLNHSGIPVYSLDVTILGNTSMDRRLRDARQAIQLSKQLDEIWAKEQPDILHIHGVFDFFLLGNRLAKKCDVPVLNHLHGELTSSLSSDYIEALRQADFVVAVSHAVAQSFRQIEPKVSSVVIANGVADLEPRPKIFEIKIITLVGRLEEQKGFHVAFEALARLVSKGHSFDIHIVGIGNHQYLQREAIRLGIDELVTFHGRCNRDQTLNVMRASDLILVPSTSIEGFSLVAAEASLMRIPVIASSVGGLTKTVKHEFSGLIVDPSDPDALASSINRYISDIDLANLHGKNGRAYILEEFSLDRYASEMYLTYLSLLKSFKERCN